MPKRERVVRVYQQTMPVMADIPTEVAVDILIPRVATTKHAECGQDVIKAWITTPEPLKHAVGRELLLRPEPDIGGTYYLVGAKKGTGHIARVARDEDRTLAMEFYREHRCPGFRSR